MDDRKDGVPRSIIGYHLDDDQHWVAQLSCGHNQHVRHLPPLVRREWVQTSEGREQMIGFELCCRKCVEGAPADERPTGTVDTWPGNG